jgi:hypothetical protein
MPEFTIVPMREAHRPAQSPDAKEDSCTSISIISSRFLKGRLASFTLGSMKILSPSDGG